VISQLLQVSVFVRQNTVPSVIQKVNQNIQDEEKALGKGYSQLHERVRRERRSDATTMLRLIAACQDVLGATNRIVLFFKAIKKH